MKTGRAALTITGVMLIAIPASANFPTPEKYPGACIAIYNPSKAILSVEVITPNDYRGLVWKIGPSGTAPAVTLNTLAGPIVSSEGDWDISVAPTPSNIHWQYLPAKTQSCAGTWYASVGVSGK
jgi:hypothetical protein